jgi:hypothetical protein
MKNINKICKSCGKDFVISIEEQEFLKGIAKKMTEEGTIEKEEAFVLPERCLECRRQRRQNNENK